MATRGGSAGITGYDYQCWFIAYQISRLVLDEDLTIHPEAKIIHTPEFNSNGQIIGTKPEINYVDDVIVYKDRLPTVYNIKYLAPRDSYWTLGRLKSEGVIEDIIQQTKTFPEQKIIFVSQSSCPLFNDLFKKVRSLKTKNEVELALNKKQKKDWEDLKHYTSLNDKELIKISRYVNYERGYEIEKYQELILSFFKEKFDKYEQLPLTLYHLAVESCKESYPILLKNFLQHLEKNNIRPISKFKIVDLLQESKKVSASLQNWNNVFGNIDSTHIKRSEVDAIIDWIRAELPLNKKPIMVLSGRAGSGKSVVLRDVIEETNRLKINCIGLKVDLYDAKDFNELNLKLNLSEDFEKLVTSLAVYGELVIILDQLDSLSMSLSSSRKSLNFYFDLINRISLIPRVKIILSCRTYDLNFDPTLKVLDKETKIELGELSNSEINIVLNHFNISCEILPLSLHKLLKTPQHLNIFCSIYDKNVKLEEIKSIQDLYNELWIKKIANKIDDYPSLPTLIKEIVSEMSEDQKLNVSKIIYQDRFINDTKYLLSEGILSSDSSSIQFFHQTFYEYCFARLFVVDKKDVTKYIFKSHQGLFIRSTIKHVLTYSKSVTPADYLKTVYELLNSNKIRIHLKYLIISMIGSDDNPLDEEWELLKKIVVNNKKLTPLFLESINNIFWFNKLNSRNLIAKYLETKDDNLRRSCETIFYRLVDIEPITILKFLLESENFNNKESLTSNVLFYLKDWNNQESIKLLDTIKNVYDESFTFHLSSLLEKAFKYHKEWVVVFLEGYLNKIIDRYCNADDFEKNDLYGYEIGDIINKFYNSDPKSFIETLLPITKKLVYCSKFDFNTQYIVDKIFYGHEQFDSIYVHWKLLDYLIECSEKFAKENEEYFKKIIVPLKDEKSLTLINILLSGIIANSTHYVDLFYYLLLKPDFLKEYDFDSTVANKVHKLINSCYSLLKPEQKTELNKLFVLSEDERLKKGDERRWKGSHIYSLLNSIPDNELKQFPQIQKRCLEFQRKFGVRVNSEPIMTSVGMVGPPLPESAYKKMNLENWLSSLKEYNESTGWHSGFQNKRGFHFGGLVQHSHEFKEIVKSEPEKFYTFLEEIIEMNIATDYLSEGLLGLVEANYDFLKVSAFIKKIFNKDKSEKIKKTILRAIEYVDQNGTLDQELFKIVKDLALNDPDPIEEIWEMRTDRNIVYYGGDPLTAGINTIRGSAIFTLLRLQSRYKFINEIFEILEKISKDISVSVRCAAVINLNVLIKLDEERTFKIFYLFTEEKNPHVLKNSLRCLSFYSKKKFHLIKNRIIACSKIEGDYGYVKVKHFVGQIVMYLFTEGIKGSKGLFEELFESSSEFKSGALNYSFYILSNKNISKRNKSRRVFLSLLNSQNQIIQQEYSHSFKDFTPEMFLDIYSLLLAYCKNRKIKKREMYNLHKYLLSCMNHHPKECINLVELLISNFETVDGEYYAVEDPIRLLIGSYNRLKEYKLKNIYLEKAMDIFDKLVQIPNFRNTTNKILFEADYN